MYILQQFLRNNSIPAIWKQAYVTPIHKKGNRSDPRIIALFSLTSFICKLWNIAILVRQITKHLYRVKWYSNPSAAWVRSRHSCEGELFLTTNDPAKAIDDKVKINITILDFSKTFDKVAHNRLIHKLDFYGIRGNQLGWLISFLSNHTQQMVQWLEVLILPMQP